jgi:hypothetical protein
MSPVWKAVLKRCQLILLMAAVCLLACSCSKKGPPQYPVHGTVLFEGEPLAEALVIFNPVNDPDGKAPKPRAVAAEDGSFKVFTEVADDGAPAGEYIITVVWKKKRLTPEEKKKKDRVAKQDVPFPARYKNPATSGLRVQVQEGSNELPPFNLKR